jgi:hypothetical protein
MATSKGFAPAGGRRETNEMNTAAFRIPFPDGWFRRQHSFHGP